MFKASVISVLMLSMSGFGAAAIAGDLAGGGDTPKPNTVYAPAHRLPRAIVEKAINATPFRCFRNNREYSAISGGGGENIVLAVSAWQGDTTVDAALLQHIRFSLEGDNCILAGGGYWTQHERNNTGMYTLAKLTPRIWNQLSVQEHAKIDLLMKAALVATAYTTSDATNIGRLPTTLEGDENLNRDWNPNYREGLVGMMIVGTVYFGGIAETTKILDTYNHDAFVAQLKEAKLTNTLATFTWKQNHTAPATGQSKSHWAPSGTAPTGEMITAAIKNYRFKNQSLREPMDLYYTLTMGTYGAKVTAGINDGKGIAGAGCLVSGADKLPNIGKDGMLLEFASRDAKGPRSSAAYAYGGFFPNLVNHIVIVAGGYWKEGPQAEECLARMSVGIPDLAYKLEHGYRDYSKGAATTTITDRTRIGDITRDQAIWENIIKAWHTKAN